MGWKARKGFQNCSESIKFSINRVSLASTDSAPMQRNTRYLIEIETLSNVN